MMFAILFVAIAAEVRVVAVSAIVIVVAVAACAHVYMLHNV